MLIVLGIDCHLYYELVYKYKDLLKIDCHLEMSFFSVGFSV